MKLPETDEEITEFIRATNPMKIGLSPSASAKLLARLCVQLTQIEKFEAECARLHSLWHAAESQKTCILSDLKTALDLIDDGGDQEGCDLVVAPLRIKYFPEPETI